MASYLHKVVGAISEIIRKDVLDIKPVSGNRFKQLCQVQYAVASRRGVRSVINFTTTVVLDDL